MAYGDLVDHLLMLSVCPGAIPVGKSKLENCRLVFKGSEKKGTIASIESASNSNVPIVVYEVPDEELNELDMYMKSPNLCYKMNRVVHFKDMRTDKDESVDAFTYVVRDVNFYGSPLAEYFLRCRIGYLHWGFDPTNLIEAYAKSKIPKAQEIKI